MRLYSEIQCIMGNGQMETPVNRHADIRQGKTLPSRNFVDGAVTKKS